MAREGYPLLEGETLPAELEDWRLMKIAGWTCDEIDAAPALRTDMVLRIDDVMNAPREEDD